MSKNRTQHVFIGDQEIPDNHDLIPIRTLRPRFTVVKKSRVPAPKGSEAQADVPQKAVNAVRQDKDVRKSNLQTTRQREVEVGMTLVKRYLARKDRAEAEAVANSYRLDYESRVQCQLVKRLPAHEIARRAAALAAARHAHVA